MPLHLSAGTSQRVFREARSCNHCVNSWKDLFANPFLHGEGPCAISWTIHPQIVHVIVSKRVAMPQYLIVVVETGVISPSFMGAENITQVYRTILKTRSELHRFEKTMAGLKAGDGVGIELRQHILMFNTADGALVQGSGMFIQRLFFYLYKPWRAGLSIQVQDSAQIERSA
jgi:hypothetical protein